MRAPVSVRRSSGRRASEAPLARGSFLERQALNRTRRADLYEELAEYIANKVTLIAALEEIRSSVEGGRPDSRTAHGRAIEKIAKAVVSRSLAQAVAPYASATEQLVLGAGEKDLVVALKRAARLLRITQDTASKMVSGLAYPVGLLNLSVAALYGYATRILPSFADLFPVEQFTGISAALASVSFAVRDGIVLGYSSAAILVGLVIFSLPVWTGQLRARLDLFFPWSIYRAAQGANFMLSLAALLAAKHRLPDALEFLAQTATPWLRERVMATRANIKGGDANLGVALREAAFNFPDPELIRRLIAISQFRDVDSQLELLAEAWIARMKAQIDRRIGQLGTVCMGLVIASMAFIGMGMLDMVQQFGARGAGGG